MKGYNFINNRLMNLKVELKI